MNSAEPHKQPPRTDATRLARELRALVAGELRTDRLARTLYATDASIYQIIPEGVLLPRSVEDVITAVRLCGRAGLPLTARGAGTGLTGAAVNRGLVMDLSRHMNRIMEIDPERRTARVQPGVVLDELNAELKPHRLQFAPDVATSSRATIGGMIAVNSCGAHSIRYGRTVDHVLALDVVLSDGSRCTWGRNCPRPDNPLAIDCEHVLTGVANELAGEISARYPKILRCNGGYALDRLRVSDDRPNAETIICGSEGTLAVVVEAKLNLVPLPDCTGLLIATFDDLEEALAAVTPMLEHSPAALELIDDLVLSATEDKPAMADRRWFVEPGARAVLACEMFADSEGAAQRALSELLFDLKSRGIGRNHHITTNAARQADVWAVRKAGLGLLMSRPGDRQPYAFIEDAAVEPRRLPDYIQRLDEILTEEGIEQTGHYAHASVGCLHVRPVLNLKQHDDIERMKRIAERVAGLVCEFGGTMSGEHGDGIVRSVWLEKMYGPRILAAFRQVKDAFDPGRIFNPGKIVDPLPMSENLRFGQNYRSTEVPTVLDFAAFGGMAGLVEMCSGVGQCRQRLVGTMCPSFVATGDETHTTRARANALRAALSNRGLLDGLSDPALDEVMDLCLSCKACRTECPTGIDMARLKAEWLHQRNQNRGTPRRSRLVGASARLAKWGSHFAPLSNRVMRAGVTRVIMEHLFGLDRRVAFPPFAHETFREWFAGREAPSRGVRGRQVVYFVDTWTNFYEPQIGRATVKVLEALGLEVLVPPTQCCGRPLISKGLLAEAARLADENVKVLGPLAEAGIPIVGSEPSCVSALHDELPQLVPGPASRCVAEYALSVESFVAAELRANPQALRFREVGDTAHAEGRATPRLIYHGHCHQKALTGTADALAVLQACTRGRAAEIDSGCCGMAGAFGHEVEHYEIARKIGESRLFPAIRARGEADVAASGFSCRQHIRHHTGVQARHAIEYVADSLTD